MATKVEPICNMLAHQGNILTFAKTLAIMLRQIQRDNDMFFPHIIFFHNILNKDRENTESMCICLNASKAKKHRVQIAFLNVCRLQRFKPNVPFEYYFVFGCELFSCFVYALGSYNASL